MLPGQRLAEVALQDRVEEGIGWPQTPSIRSGNSGPRGWGCACVARATTHASIIRHDAHEGRVTVDGGKLYADSASADK